MTLRLTPYLMMNRNAKEAIEFYEGALGAQILSMITYGELPMGVSGELKGNVAHACAKIGESNLMFSDCIREGQPTQSGDQLTVCISTKDVEKSKEVFEALQENGQVVHPLEETPFSPAFGVVTDKFGVTFQIVAESQQQMKENA
jgi:PhnB protein